MKKKCDCVYGQAGECPEATCDRNLLQSESDCPSWWRPSSWKTKNISTIDSDMAKRKSIKHKTIAEYQSTVVGKNDDNTYEVRHIFTDKNGREILVRYPRVEITIDTDINAFDPFPRVFPYGSCKVLPYGEAKELFTLTIEE